MQKAFLAALILFFILTLYSFIPIDWFFLPVVAQQPPTSLDPDRESGRNKDARGATVLLVGTSDPRGEISYDDGDRTDWYRIRVIEDGELVVFVENRITGDLNLEAYAPDRTTKLAESLTSGAGNEQVRFPVQAKKWYYVKVYANQPGDAGDYTISNTFSRDPDWNSGRNKDANGATEIPLGGGDDNGEINYNRGDRTDWYKVSVRPPIWSMGRIS